jgi:acyl-CoA synthetase (AMP-forming)/AMP-acid ligase II/acyl carrier protein
MTLCNVLDALRARAAHEPDRPAFDFSSDGAVVDRLTYRELDVAARAAAMLLRSRCADGERVLLLHPPGLDFIVDFFACLYAGAVAVPTPAPASARDLRRFGAIARTAGARLALTSASGAAALARRFAERELDGVDVVVTGRGAAAAELEVATGPTSIAVLQFTSGSTSEPRGAVLTHANVGSNLAQIRDAFGLRSGESGEAVALWLPQFHDMGLFARLACVYAGCPGHLISPLDFARRPFRWLELVSSRRATVTGAPNFAFDLCVDRIPAAERAALDLSSLRIAFCGAEPVRPATLVRFAEAFAPSGFAANALLPCYGLAEATLLVAAAEPGAGPRVRTSPNVGRALVSCGAVHGAFEVAIVDPERRTRASDGATGEIWLRGPSVAREYFGDETATRETFGGRIAGEGGAPYLRTGDLGFVEDGELFVAGRRKAMIVVQGRNVFLQDVEHDASRAHPALTKAAAFAERDGDEALVVLCEVAREQRRNTAALDEALDLVHAAIVANHDCSPAEIVLVESGSITQTTSGKVVRGACREAWRAGSLRALARRRGAAAGADGGAMPSGALEEALAQIVREVTGLESVRRDQSLYALGCDSIAAARIVDRIEERFGLALDAERAYEEPTVAVLARLVDERLVQAVEAISDEEAAALLAGERGG